VKWDEVWGAEGLRGTWPALPPNLSCKPAPPPPIWNEMGKGDGRKVGGGLMGKGAANVCGGCVSFCCDFSGGVFGGLRLSWKSAFVW
jgi:hypothetical protein